MGRYATKLRRFLLHTVLHADDSPHAIALGVGIGMVVAFLPIVGLQMIVAIGLAALFRANKAVCVPIIWITNPLTFLPIYGGCLAIGRAVVPSATSDGAADLSRLGHVEMNLLTLGFWKDIFSVLLELGVELWIGCAIVGVFFGVTSYFTARWGVSAYRERRRQKILRRNLLRSQTHKGRITRRSDVA